MTSNQEPEEHEEPRKDAGEEEGEYIKLLPPRIRDLQLFWTQVVCLWVNVTRLTTASRQLREWALETLGVNIPEIIPDLLIEVFVPLRDDQTDVARRAFQPSLGPARKGGLRDEIDDRRLPIGSSSYRRWAQGLTPQKTASCLLRLDDLVGAATGGNLEHNGESFCVGVHGTDRSDSLSPQSGTLIVGCSPAVIQPGSTDQASGEAPMEDWIGWITPPGNGMSVAEAFLRLILTKYRSPAWKMEQTSWLRSAEECLRLTTELYGRERPIPIELKRDKANGVPKTPEVIQSPTPSPIETTATPLAHEACPKCKTPMRKGARFCKMGGCDFTKDNVPTPKETKGDTTVSMKSGSAPKQVESTLAEEICPKCKTPMRKGARFCKMGECDFTKDNVRTPEKPQNAQSPKAPDEHDSNNVIRLCREPHPEWRGMRCGRHLEPGQERCTLCEQQKRRGIGKN